ncbi:MAG: symmetrical bis(5'-nucleosyl)-tetraphosphatase [Legionella sp.]|nr:symmetrical bis(5'-nucleosyl)-tetraphosphatase [Legionella sp.]
MADYAIGDVQGCYDALQKLLETIDFHESTDQLWFVGDLVNRGPQSLAVLRFIHALSKPAMITLGNHDLHLLACLFGTGLTTKNKDDTLQEILQADDGEELGHWLRKQPIICYSPKLQVLMCHAGISPLWDLNLAIDLAKEVQAVLSGEHYKGFLNHMYGNQPSLWSDEITGIDRLRLITNYFTRMRYCDAQGGLDFSFKGPINQAPAHLYPWYEVPGRKAIEVDIIFGHWAALMGNCAHPTLHPIDTGCHWGGKLTALRLQDKRVFSTPCALRYI